MPIVSIPGSVSMDVLAATLSKHEQLNIEEVTDLKADDAEKENLATTVDYLDKLDQFGQLGPIYICASGGHSKGKKILSTTGYICGAKTAIDLYRLPLSSPV